MVQLDRPSFEIGLTLVTTTSWHLYPIIDAVEHRIGPVLDVPAGCRFVLVSCVCMHRWECWTILYCGRLYKMLLGNDDVEQGRARIV